MLSPSESSSSSSPSTSAAMPGMERERDITWAAAYLDFSARASASRAAFRSLVATANRCVSLPNSTEKKDKRPACCAVRLDGESFVIHVVATRSSRRARNGSGMLGLLRANLWTRHTDKGKQSTLLVSRALLAYMASSKSTNWRSLVNVEDDVPRPISANKEMSWKKYSRRSGVTARTSS